MVVVVTVIGKVEVIGVNSDFTKVAVFVEAVGGVEDAIDNLPHSFERVASFRAPTHSSGPYPLLSSHPHAMNTRSNRVLFSFTRSITSYMDSQYQQCSPHQTQHHIT